MKQLFKKCIIVILAFIITDVIVGYTYSALLKELPDVGGHQMNGYQALLKDTSDLIILGASQSRVDYDAGKIGEAMKMSAYIAGLPRHDMVYNDIVLNAYLNRHKPQIVLLDIYPVYIDGSMLPERYNHVSCFYGLSDELTKSMDESLSWTEKLKYRFNLYKYNNSLPWLVTALLGKDRNNHGFEPHNGIYTENSIHEQRNSIKIDPTELQHLDHIVNSCKDNNIQLFIFSAPSFSYTKGFSEWLKKYGEDHDVKVFDYSYSKQFRNYKLFSDVVHLNYDGTEKYTNCVINNLKSEMLKK